MTGCVTIKLSDDEVAMILAALETGREIYLASARGSGADGCSALAGSLADAADRICAFRTRFQRGIAGLRRQSQP